MADITAPQLEDPSQMSLWSHLAELRNRIFWAFGAIVIGTIIGFFFAGDALNLLRQPYCQVVEAAASCELKILDPTGGVMEYFRTALLIGGILSIPILTYQIMMFIMPGLTNKERRAVLLALPAITFLFLAGAIFAWAVLLPPALGFLENFASNVFAPEWTADLYIGFVTALVFWMGVASETPLVFFVLSLFSVVTPRPMIRNWRFAVVGAAIAAALITPTIDPVNMSLVMGPLLTLYVLSIFLVWIGSRMAIVPPPDPLP
jgi:sec-independent protein translocase protein TatC